jgi:hypothetical protein
VREARYMRLISWTSGVVANSNYHLSHKKHKTHCSITYLPLLYDVQILENNQGNDRGSWLMKVQNCLPDGQCVCPLSSRVELIIL